MSWPRRCSRKSEHGSESIIGPVKGHIIENSSDAARRKKYAQPAKAEIKSDRVAAILQLHVNLFHRLY